MVGSLKVLCHSCLLLSFCLVGRSAPDASPHVAPSPPMFYQAGTAWPLSCKQVVHCALSRPINQTNIKQIRASQTVSGKWNVANETHIYIAFIEESKFLSHFKEGLMLILVPAPIKPSCFLQKSFQSSDLCREVSVQGFGLMEKMNSFQLTPNTVLD